MKKNQVQSSEYYEKIKSIFIDNPKSKFNYKQLTSRFSVKNDTLKDLITEILQKLKKDELIIEAYRGKYVLNPKHQKLQRESWTLIQGTVDMKQTGKAYILTPDLLDDVRIAPNNTNKALHGDVVKVRLFPKRKDQKLEGEIIEIVKRSKTTFVGIIALQKNFAFLIPDNKSTPVDIYIPIENLNGATNGIKAVAEITDWPDHAKNPFGKIIRILGKPGLNDVEIHSILEDYNLPYNFPIEVSQAADKIGNIITDKDVKSREDFRNQITFTIDPYDAKDFDDALSIRKLQDNQLEIGVHIADVSHYVKTNDILDKDAYLRGTSVYLVDRVVPMLPEKISNELCSLRPNEDKLTYSVVFTMDDSHKIQSTRFVKSLIHSKRRFTYEEVQEIIENESGDLSAEIIQLNEIAKKLRNKRMKDGAINFEKKEVKFELDETGKPISVFYKESKDAHKLVEEFMLLANKAVAEKIGKIKKGQQQKTFVYRIHDIPNPEKLNTLSEFVRKLGYKLSTDTRKNISQSFNKLLKDSEGKGEHNMIETLSIRSMAKAEYSTDNIGHYGLAFDFYTHFTSPIRRYPDLMVHRLLNSYLSGAASEPKDIYEQACIHSTEREKVAQSAERDSIKLKQVEFLSDRIGQEYEGVISGISKWGIFVEIIENKCEGMIRMKDLTDDYYYLDEDNYQVLGFNSKKKYALGDKITISIKSVDATRREIDFKIV